MLLVNITKLLSIALVMIMTLTVLSGTGVFTVRASNSPPATPTVTVRMDTASGTTPSQTIVCIGDSLTASNGGIWPNILGQRLGSGWSVINKGIDGNTVDQMVARFDTDVNAYHPAYVIILAGTAELTRGGTPLTVEPRIATLCNLARENGSTPVMCTIPPDNHAGVSIQTVNDLNAWITSYAHSHGYDSINFYSLLNDPSNPGHMLPQYDSGDHVHPNNAGYQAMGNFVPLTIFKTPTTLTVSNSPSYPTRGQSYTVSGYLKTSSGSPLANKPIQVSWRCPPATSYTYSKTVTTDANGRYSFTDSASGHRSVQYQLVFPGDTTYAGKTVTKAVYNGLTTTSIASSNTNPTPHQTYTLSGYVKDGSGTGLVGVPVKLRYRVLSNGVWSPWYTSSKTLTTTTGGYYSVSDAASHVVQYNATFQGYPLGGSTAYWSSNSTTVQVDAT